MDFYFRRHFRWAEHEKCISVSLYVKLFKITPYVNDFQTLNNSSSGQPVGALKLLLPSIFEF